MYLGKYKLSDWQTNSIGSSIKCIDCGVGNYTILIEITIVYPPVGNYVFIWKVNFKNQLEFLQKMFDKESALHDEHDVYQIPNIKLFVDDFLEKNLEKINRLQGFI